MINSNLYTFLDDLSKNNNRKWFSENKATFIQQQKNFKELIETFESDLNQTDEIEKAKIFRIYRDVRFSKDKTPYKTFFSANLIRATAVRRGGYFIKIGPKKNLIGGGFYNPESKDLLRIRKEIEFNPKPLRKILSDAAPLLGDLQGSELKTAPRGFNKGDPALDLLRKKQFFFFRTFSDKEVQSKEFSAQVEETFKSLRPFFDYMSDVLSTDLNGESTL